MIDDAFVVAGALTDFVSGNSKGVTQDSKEAVKWYMLAAEQGYSNAQFSLGLLYGKGEGLAHDKMQAYAWHSAVAA